MVVGQVTRFFGLLFIPLGIEVVFLLWFAFECIWGWIDTRNLKGVIDPDFWKLRLRIQIYHSGVLLLTVLLFFLDIPVAIHRDVECATGFGGRGVL